MQIFPPRSTQVPYNLTSFPLTYPKIIGNFIIFSIDIGTKPLTNIRVTNLIFILSIKIVVFGTHLKQTDNILCPAVLQLPNDICIRHSIAA